MTYDPREGQSPYLGMDVSDEDFAWEDEAEREGEFPAASEYQAQVPLQQEVSVPPASDAHRTTPVTMRRGSGAPKRGVVPRQAPVGAAAGYTAQSAPIEAPLRRPVPSPPQNRPPVSAPRSTRDKATPPRAFLFLGSMALRLLALVARLAAIVLSVVVVASAVLTDSRRYVLVQVLNIAHAIVPAGVLGRFVCETPLGGALRGDLVILSVVLFVVDWLCLVYAKSLRGLQRRGA